MSDKEETVVTSANGDGNTLPLLADSDNGNLLEENGKVKKGNGDHDDGASEKLVPGDGKVTITSNKDSSEVKFNLSDSQNGDAKIDMEPIKMIFAGMGKEELLKFANDPFWVRLRWFLFALFWLVWAAMLAGAIAIIVVAPKCSSPEPLKWWEQGPLYHVYVRSFKDGSEPQSGSGNLKGLVSELDYIQDIGIKGVMISSVVTSSSMEIKDDDIINFQEIDPVYGSIDDFKNLIAELKTRGMHLVMTFVLNHSSDKHPWFRKSEMRETPYDNYYIWAPGMGTTSDGKRIPPNNWLSVNTQGSSAWKWSEERNEFYLHQFGENQPDFNFRNPALIDEIKKILDFWLDLGVDGFQFEKAQFLMEDSNLKNESVGGIPGTIHDEYNFYSHHQTLNLPESLGVLAELKQVVLNRRGTDGFMSITGNTPVSWTEVYGNHSNIIDLPRNSSLFVQLEPGFNGEDLRVRVDKWLSAVPKGTFPGWQLGEWWRARLATRFPEDIVDGLNMVAMLLPGTPITMYGEEIGLSDGSLMGIIPMHWDNASSGLGKGGPWYHVEYKCESCNVKEEQEAQESHLKVYKALTEARKSPSIMYGDHEIILTANKTVFAFTRIKSGNPGYLVAFNTGYDDVTADFSELDNLSEELTVIMRSSNMQNNAVAIKSKWPKEGVPIPANQALVLTFVPKKNE